MIKLVPSTTKINSQAVEQLTELLSRAEHGDILDMCVVYKTSSGGYNHMWTASDDLVSLLGANHRMSVMINKRIDDAQT